MSSGLVRRQKPFCGNGYCRRNRQAAADTGGKAGKLLKVVIAVSACAAVAAPVGTTAATAAAEQNRAVLVVNTGEQVKKVCVRFWEESISGAELLRRAEVDAAMRPYAGKGVAVCSLCGVGCKTDDSCLTCDPDGRYWAYSRAPAGTSGFRLSPAGASNTEVRNGDVEGWRWSRGTSPVYLSVAEVCDGTSPATAGNTGAASTTTVAGGQSPVPGVTPDGAVTSTTASTVRPSSPAPRSIRTGLPVSSTTSSFTTIGPSSTVPPVPPSGSGPATGPAGSGPDTEEVAAQRAARRDRGGSPAGLVAFAGVLAGVLGWAAWARRRRQRHPPD
ncbi:MAG TPA: hypothetical protein VM142_12885 [Acidimicrobiales bacterium]|nr:hypothetical protein [Acidimicrobiales bacterium]